MYLHHCSPFGNHQRHTIEHVAAGNSFSFVPSAGAIVLHLNFQNQPILDGYDSAEALAALEWMKNIVLFPFPNRLNGGKYPWLGVTYFFEKNHPQTQNALHGFAYAETFNLTQVLLTPHFAHATCRLNYSGQYPAYPFPFVLDIQFRIDNSCRFDVTFRIKNSGTTALPMGVGWHPYFRLTTDVAQTQLLMPPTEQVEIDARMLPTGRKSEFHSFQRFEPIAHTSLDNCFKINTVNKKWQVMLRGNGSTIRLQADASVWKFLQVFTPPHRTSIALEPMTCNVDAFNSGDGLIALPPWQTWKGSFTVFFSK